MALVDPHPTKPIANTLADAAEVKERLDALYSYLNSVSADVPLGTIVMFVGTTAPAGWMLCQGQSLNRVGSAPTGYAALFAVIGTAFGAVDGAHFNLPNLQGRVPLGVGGGHSMGGSGGAETHVLSNGEMPAHQHTIGISSGYKFMAYNGTPGGIHFADGTFHWFAQGDATDASGGGGAHNNMPPFLTVNYIIRAA